MQHTLMSLFGTVLLAFGIGLVVGLVKYWGTLKQEWTTARQTESKASAERILNDRKRVLSKAEPPQPARSQDFAFRGFAFYEASQAALQRAGCTMLGDFGLDQPAWTVPGFRTFVRVLRTDDRQTVCTIIDATPNLAGTSGFVKLRFYMAGMHRHYLKAISLRTELSDGSFLITTTHADFVKEELPPEILREAVPRATPVPALLKRHRERVASTAERTNATVVPIGTVDQFGQSFVRYQSTVRALREKIGYAFTNKEQQYFDETDPRQDAEMARSMFEAMREMENDGKKRAS